jgi:hypothetical protein
MIPAVPLLVVTILTLSMSTPTLTLSTSISTSTSSAATCTVRSSLGYSVSHRLDASLIVALQVAFGLF